MPSEEPWQAMLNPLRGTEMVSILFALNSVKNKNGTYICNYDTTISDPIPSHYLESPLEKATDVKRGEYERVYTATVDPDVAKMENLMDQWCLDLKRNVLVSNIRTFEPPHDKTNKMACAPSEDSDQPGHLPSLIRVAWASAQSDQSLRCPHEESLGP